MDASVQGESEGLQQPEEEMTVEEVMAVWWSAAGRRRVMRPAMGTGALEVEREKIS